METRNQESKEGVRKRQKEKWTSCNTGGDSKRVFVSGNGVSINQVREGGGDQRDFEKKGKWEGGGGGGENATKDEENWKGSYC